jgi:hypothetical protein
MPSRSLRVRTAAVAGLAALSLGGVAAAATAGRATASAERATNAPPSTSGGQPAAAHGQAATFVRGPDATPKANRSAAHAGTRSDHMTGPDASGAARHGLCQAWFAGQGDTNGRRTDAPAFRALAAAAGGADHVAAYCQAEAASSAAHGQRPATPPSRGKVKTAPPATGPPASPGNGHGQGHGGPPTA